jgi:hypothetical protein
MAFFKFNYNYISYINNFYWLVKDKYSTTSHKNKD